MVLNNHRENKKPRTEVLILVAQDRVQLLALRSGRRVYRGLDKLRSAVPEQVFYSHLSVCMYVYI